MSAQNSVIEKVLTCVANKLNMKKWRYEIRTLPGNIVNYIGNLVSVALIDESSEVTTQLIIKADPSVLIPEIELIAKGAYIREVYFYTTLIPLFKKNTNISDYYFPECYFADSSKGNRVLALQNMAVQGFERHDKGRFLDKEHLVLSLEAVAKLHSLSLILKKKKIKPEDDYVMKPFSPTNEPQYANSLQTCFKKYGVHMSKGTVHEEFFKNFYSTMSDMTQFLDNCVINAHVLVYGHGDLWKENFLYKYSDNRPVQVCLLDYQMCHLMSPACDVLFLIMNSTDSTVRREHYQTFLSTYYKALKRSLRDNEIDSSHVYSEADFRDDIKLVFPLCFSVTLFSFALWLGFESILSLLDTTGTVNVEAQQDNVNLFFKIIGDLVTDFREFGTIV